jgi:hypothetical protein
MTPPAEVFGRVLEALDRLEIPYLVGGSVASSIHGNMRPTMDVDIVADLKLEQLEEFAALLQPDFYADAAAMREALKYGRAFNVVHYETSFKVDIFPLKKDQYSRESFARRRFAQSRSFGPEPIECAVASPEDTILRKLEWFRAGGETSERQWNDMRGVLKVSGAGMDREYMRKWSKFLQVEDLLERLLAEFPNASVGWGSASVEG